MIKDEINVKKVTFGKTLKLDTKITPELKEEGMVREVIRSIQEMRKKSGLTPKNKISIQYSTASFDLNKILEKNKDSILKKTLAKDMEIIREEKIVSDKKHEVFIDNEKLRLSIKKL